MKRIAIVEDLADNRLLLVAILDPYFKIDEYENGEEALKGIIASPPDVVLLDISLPRLDGVQVLEQIRSYDHIRQLVVVAITAHAMVGDREHYLGLGFDDYFSKPILDHEELYRMVASHIV